MSDLLYNGYLGGHAWITHTDSGALEYIKNKYSINTMIDIGCGPGGQVELAKQMGIAAVGVDGDPRVVEKNPAIIECDYTKAAYQERKFDFGWSCEFLEHVEEQYQPNYMKTFQQCHYVFASHALPGTESPTNHHVNCKYDDYWIAVFEQYGFVYDAKETEQLRAASTMKRNFVRESGLFFINPTWKV